ncbi:MAG: hypothetical protein ACW99V_09930, partial [Candidatus Thorarchaeota archaeon]
MEMLTIKESSSNDETSEGIRYVLYSFWDNIPRIEFANVSKEILESHPARKAILRILREGILEETVPPSDDHIIRRAINADEIR